MTNESLIFYKDWWDAIKLLPEEMRMQAVEAVMEYAFTGAVPDDPMMKFATAQIRMFIDRNKKRYEQKRGKRTEDDNNDNKIVEDVQKQQSEDECIQSGDVCIHSDTHAIECTRVDTPHYLNDNVNGNGNGNGNGNENGNGNDNDNDNENDNVAVVVVDKDKSLPTPTPAATAANAAIAACAGSRGLSTTTTAAAEFYFGARRNIATVHCADSRRQAMPTRVSPSETNPGVTLQPQKHPAAAAAVVVDVDVVAAPRAHPTTPWFPHIACPQVSARRAVPRCSPDNVKAVNALAVGSPPVATDAMGAGRITSPALPRGHSDRAALQFSGFVDVIPLRGRHRWRPYQSPTPWAPLTSSLLISRVLSPNSRAASSLRPRKTPATPPTRRPES